MCQTICVANTGAASKETLLEELGIAPGQSMIRALRKEDNERIKNSGRKISLRYRNKRKHMKFARKTKTKDKSYRAGSYGTSSKVDNLVKRKKN